MNGHRSCTNAKSHTFLYEHFNIPGHSFEKAYIQIIDFVDPNISNDIKNDLRIREDYWIDKLGTAYPLGLNDNKKGCGNISQGKYGVPEGPNQKIVSKHIYQNIYQNIYRI